MNKMEIEKLYNELKHCKIDDLYHYSCLLLSGFEKDTAFELITFLNDLYLHDENNYSISKLSDMLYNVYDDIDDDMSIYEVLNLMYEEDF